MGLSIFGYIVVAVLIGAPVLAIAAVVVSLKRNTFQAIDIGTLLFPPVLFIVLGSLRSDIQIGWAMLLWPIIIAVMVMYAFAFKIFALEPHAGVSSVQSTGLFLICLAVAALLAFVVSPWYD